jgi:hypothetical protein
LGDLKERAYWQEYQDAYEKAINATSKKGAPWFIIPADDKWYARLAIASIIYQQFEQMQIAYPDVNARQKAELTEARIVLMQEEEADKKKGKKSTRKEASF